MPVTACISFNRLTGLVIICGFLLAAGAAIADQPPMRKTGVAFRRQLDERVDITLQGRLLPLREALDHLSSGYSVAIFLDRRIDPDQLVDYKARDTALETVVQQTAAAA